MHVIDASDEMDETTEKLQGEIADLHELLETWKDLAMALNELCWLPPNSIVYNSKLAERIRLRKMQLGFEKEEKTSAAM